MKAHFDPSQLDADDANFPKVSPFVSAAICVDSRSTRSCEIFVDGGMGTHFTCADGFASNVDESRDGVR